MIHIITIILIASLLIYLAYLFLPYYLTYIMLLINTDKSSSLDTKSDILQAIYESISQKHHYIIYDPIPLPHKMQIGIYLISYKGPSLIYQTYSMSKNGICISGSKVDKHFEIITIDISIHDKNMLNKIDKFIISLQYNHKTLPTS